MAKHDTKTKTKTTKKQDGKDAKGGGLDPKAAKKLAAQAAKDQADAAKAAKAAKKLAAQAAKDQADAAKRAQEAAPASTPVTGVDEVHVLRLALRDTEARLTEVEALLRRVQQELVDERRAAADADAAPIEDAIVDAAVAATVADAVARTGVQPVDDLTAALVAEEVALELDADAAGASVADAADDHTGEAQDAAAAFTEPAIVDVPEPVATAERAEDEPNESWTMFRLRAEARRRHLSGFSTLSKANLLARLRE